MNRSISIDEERVFSDFGKLSGERKKEVANFVTYLKAKEGKTIHHCGNAFKKLKKSSTTEAQR